jgi:hypothetical protein
MAISRFIRKYVQRHSKWTFEGGQKISGAPIIFLHIPKCAGQAFRHSLANAVHASSILSFFDHSLFGAFDRFDTIAPELRASIYGAARQIPKAADFVGGHFAVSTARRYYPQANYCTVLREPASRLLSHWLFWRQHSDEDFESWGAHWGDRIRRARRPLVDFLRDPDLACQTDNLVVRMLLWPDPRIPANDFICASQDKALLRDAIATLRRFEFVDFVENPDCVTDVEKWIGAPFRLETVNETRQASAGFQVNLQQELTVEAHALLDERSRLDLVLWREIVERRRPNDDSLMMRTKIIISNIEHQKYTQHGRSSHI